MSRLQIFISSTSVDLQEHRRAVFDAIMQAGEYGIDMKYFGSRPDDPVSVCREAVEQADVLVGIYAMRYGWIPEGEKCSITEMEFDYARQLGKPCLCYVVDEKNANWPIHLIEFAAIAQLTAFKQKVGQLVRTTFTTPDNLAKNVVADLARLMKTTAGTGSDAASKSRKKTGKSIPPHRAFYCNRSRQMDEFLPAFFDSIPPKLLYYYLYGDAKQAHASLSVRFGHEIAGQWFDWEESDGTEAASTKKWKYRKIKPQFSGSAAMNRINLLRELYTAFKIDMNAPGADRKLTDLLKSPVLAGFGPVDTVILLLTLDDHNWQPEHTPAAVRHFIENYCDCTLPEHAPRILFLFGIEYQKQNAKVRAEVKQAIETAGHGAPLPELQPVDRRDVTEWFTLPEHEPLLEEGKTAEDMTDKHFGPFDQKDMFEIELVLKRLIEQYNTEIS
jgi:hypothetical protein